jgi:Trk K+ transport system NAD-binding subunit
LGAKMKVRLIIILLFFFNASNCKWAEETLAKLTLEEKIGQLFIIRVDSNDLRTNDGNYLLQSSMINPQQNETFSQAFFGI